MKAFSKDTPNPAARGPDAQRAITTAMSTSTASQGTRGAVAGQPLAQGSTAQSPSPSVIPLVVTSGAVVAPDLDHTVRPTAHMAARAMSAASQIPHAASALTHGRPAARRADRRAATEPAPHHPPAAQPPGTLGHIDTQLFFSINARSFWTCCTRTRRSPRRPPGAAAWRWA